MFILKIMGIWILVDALVIWCWAKGFIRIKDKED